MDAELFASALSDKHILDLKKLSYKYPTLDIKEFISILHSGFFCTLRLKDFSGNSLVFMPNVVKPAEPTLRQLLSYRNGKFGQLSMEREVSSSLAIENIDFSRDSVRKILSGRAPEDKSEHSIYGMKKALDFISNRDNKITEENIFSLYMTAIGNYLEGENRLLSGNKYRHDSVFVVDAGGDIQHSGLPAGKLPEYMSDLVEFINSENINDSLLKACILHYYIAFIHPWFDGNGRMARLMHQWYLVQSGYPSALFISLSYCIEHSREDYYKAFSLCERNYSISGTTDISPFIAFFYNKIYPAVETELPKRKTTDDYQEFLASGAVTEKESALWHFVLSVYGTNEFSTKQLEKDYGDAAYATIRSFVLKFEEHGLLSSQKYGSRVKYKVH